MFDTNALIHRGECAGLAETRLIPLKSLFHDGANYPLRVIPTSEQLTRPEL